MRARAGSTSEKSDSANIEIAEFMLSACEPQTLQEAMESDDASQWTTAINEELNSLEENNTWILVNRPKNQNVISNRWVLKIEYKSDGTIDKYKARLVIRGFSQKEGVDFHEIYPPVLKYNTVRAVLAIVAAEDLHIKQFDIKTAFLYGELEETIFMKQPLGFEIDDRVCLLKKSLYGLKQAPRQWNKRIHDFFTAYNLTQSEADACLYYTICNNNKLYVILYVDDGIICGDNSSQINNFLYKLKAEFKVKSSESEFFVGMLIKGDRENKTLKLFQSAYVHKILSRFNNDKSKSLSTSADPNVKFVKTNINKNVNSNFKYREAIGSLMFLMVGTRPDLAYIISVLSQFAENPDDSHWNGVKRVFRYLKGTTDYRISFGKNHDNSLVAYSDSDWAGDINTRKSTTGWICLLNGGAIA